MFSEIREDRSVVLLSGVAMLRVPANIPNANCSARVEYIPKLTTGIAQQQ
jgi:hypothetical protein